MALSPDGRLLATSEDREGGGDSPTLRVLDLATGKATDIGRLHYNVYEIQFSSDGARLSIPVGIAAVGLAVLLGTLIGSVAGAAGGVVDEVIMRVTDLMLAFPTVILAMIISAALGAGIRNAVIAIMVAWWPSYARFARGLVLAAREREYVEAARAAGASSVRVFLRHILVNIVSPIVILSMLDIGHAILTFASLSFLGLGPPPQIPEWGSMIAAGRDYLDQAWWIGTFPGLAILTLVLGLNVVGDSLRDALDPKLRKG